MNIAQKPSEAALTLLDSSLITQTNKNLYNIKIVNCKNFIQLYFYDCPIMRTGKGIESNITKVFNNKQKKDVDCGLKEVRIDNLFRAKNNIERLAKTNIKLFKSFITLTFKENIISSKDANKYFNTWRTRVKKEVPSFSYLCVPEFQKRGAIHYHLLTNLKPNDTILCLQEGKRYMYNIKYWNYGFSSAKPIEGINLVSYISKYITKESDNRLYGFRKYFYSKNLETPKIEYLNSENSRELEYLNNLTINFELNYSNNYSNKYNCSSTTFLEYASIL